MNGQPGQIEEIWREMKAEIRRLSVRVQILEEHNEALTAQHQRTKNLLQNAAKTRSLDKVA